MIQVNRETHVASADVARELLLAGGVNRFGEANYRAVWGWSRLDWIGGKWEDHDPASGSLLREVIELRREPKYLPHDRWHIERWMPAESYGSPEAWHAATGEFVGGRNVAALGPYPSRGDYEHCFTLEGPRGEFVQLTPAVARHVARAIETSRGVGSAKKKEALEDRARMTRSRWMRWGEEFSRTGFRLSGVRTWGDFAPLEESKHDLQKSKEDRLKPVLPKRRKLNMHSETAGTRELLPTATICNITEQHYMAHRMYGTFQIAGRTETTGKNGGDRIDAVAEDRARTGVADHSDKNTNGRFALTRISARTAVMDYGDKRTLPLAITAREIADDICREINSDAGENSFMGVFVCGGRHANRGGAEARGRKAG